MSKAQSEPEEARLGRLGRREAEEEEHDGGGARPGQAPQVRQDRVRLLETRGPRAGLLQGECGHGDVCLAGNLNLPHCIAGRHRGGRGGHRVPLLDPEAQGGRQQAADDGADGAGAPPRQREVARDRQGEDEAVHITTPGTL